MRLDDIITEHAAAISDFYRWFATRWAELNQEATAELEELNGERQRLQQRIRQLEDTLETVEKTAISIREERDKLAKELEAERQYRAWDKEGQMSSRFIWRTNATEDFGVEHAVGKRRLRAVSKPASLATDLCSLHLAHPMCEARLRASYSLGVESTLEIKLSLNPSPVFSAGCASTVIGQVLTRRKPGDLPAMGL